MPRRVVRVGNLIWSLAAVFVIHLGESEAAFFVLGPTWVQLLTTVVIVACGWLLAARVAAKRTWLPLSFVSVGVHALCIFGAGWLDVLRAYGVREIPWLGMAIALMPFLVMHSRCVALQLRAEDMPAVHRAAAIRLRLELEFFPLLPFIFLDGCVVLSGLWPPLRIAAAQIELVVWCAVALGVALLLSALPTMLRIAWRLRSMPAGPLRRDLELVAARLGFAYRDIYVWPTGLQMANAAIIGAGMRRRIVVFTDLLLATLNPAEIAAVFAHESAHAVRHHVRRYGALGFCALLLAWFASEQLAAESFWLWIGPWTSLAEVPNSVRSGTEIAVLVCIAALWWIAFGYLSRACEREADLVAMRAVGSGRLFRRALLQVCRSTGQPLDRGGWLHDSPFYRATFQQQLENDPKRAQRFQSRLRAWSFVLHLSLAVMILIKIWSYAPKLPSEWVRAELGWGAYDRAQQHASWFPEQDTREEIADLARLGRSTRALFPDERERGSKLIERAREAAQRGELQEGWHYLSLARFEGVDLPFEELESVVAHAILLRQGGFRSPWQRWQRWCDDRDLIPNAALRHGVELYLSGPDSGRPGL